MSSIHILQNSNCRVRLFHRATETLLHNVDAAVTLVGRYLPTYLSNYLPPFLFTYLVLFNLFGYRFHFFLPFSFSFLLGRGPWPPVGLGRGERRKEGAGREGQGGQGGQK
jgi:hypothetical protein